MQAKRFTFIILFNHHNKSVGKIMIISSLEMNQ